MGIRRRAIRPQDKEARRDAILDAAERLLLRERDRVGSILEVALATGLAKGTLYLYFRSKEELLLAVHERIIDGLLWSLIERLESPRSVTLDEICALTRERLAAPSLSLSLASRCAGLARTISEKAAAAFHERMMARFARAGAGLERQFEQLNPGDGVTLLRHSYALMIGLWQTCGTKDETARCAATFSTIESARAPMDCNYPDDLERALRVLWEGAIGARNGVRPSGDKASLASPRSSATNALTLSPLTPLA